MCDVIECKKPKVARLGSCILMIVENSFAHETLSESKEISNPGSWAALDSVT